MSTVNKTVVKSLRTLQKKASRFLAETEKQLARAEAGKAVAASKLEDLEAVIYGTTQDTASAISAEA